MDISRNYKGPKSICVCGHAGDGTGLADGAPDGQRVSLHAGAIGHGACAHAKCDCVKFTWAAYTPRFSEALADAIGIVP